MREREREKRGREGGGEMIFRNLFVTLSTYDLEIYPLCDKTE